MNAIQIFLINFVVFILSFFMSGFFEEADRESSRQDLKNLYRTLYHQDQNIRWPGQETLKSAEDFESWFLKKTNTTDTSFFFPNQTAVFGYCVAVPPAKFSSLDKRAESGDFPIMWTRGLDRGEVKWSDSSPWNGAGGHVLFSSGRVEWYDTTESDAGVFGNIPSEAKLTDPLMYRISRSDPRGIILNP